jgi:hypothetical protein
LEELLLDWLAMLDKRQRVPYQPDKDDAEHIVNLLTHIHVAAARAFRLKESHGLSEDVRDCLESTWQAMGRLRLIIGGPDRFYEEAPGSVISAGAICGMVLVELSQVARLDGRYEDALHLLAEAVRYYGGAVANNVEEGIEEIWPASAEDEKLWQSRLEGYLTGLDVSLNDSVTLFRQVQIQGKSMDWKQVANDCQTLAKCWSLVEAGEAPVHEPDGTERTWGEFWHVSRGWAEAQLTPSELREYLQEWEARAAVNRLRSYFFGDLWERVPPRARERLVNADLLWFSPQPVAVEDILNQLQVATESMCHAFIWEPLQQAKGGLDILEFAKKNENLRTKGRDPTLNDYAWVCRQSFLRALLERQGLGAEERDFLTADLPKALDSLRKKRDLVQHDPKKAWRREEVKPFVREFLGIGQRGILTRLAEVGAKLRPPPGRQASGSSRFGSLS